ncbi:uncharacterized protein [Medicago truncatula]|uniref:uncharacterized protein n=1 Tax=Medicago truncatula TaxID=3880 RepID=UPI000D2F153E|nr:uncharacterized protein LOC112417321 [Medicago truncatula]
MSDWLREGSSCTRSTVFLADSITNAFRKAEVTAPSPRLICWNNNNCQCTILNVDGSCLDVPIRTGFGGVFRDNTGTYIAGYSSYISHSQEFAELTALYQWLRLAINLNCEELTCYSDSLLAVNLIKDDLNHFHVYVVLIQSIMVSRNFNLHQSLIEGNQCANFMAKLEHRMMLN